MDRSPMWADDSQAKTVPVAYRIGERENPVSLEKARAP